MNYLLVCDKCGNDYGCISRDGEKECKNCSLKGFCMLRRIMDASGVHHEILGICDDCLYEAINI